MPKAGQIWRGRDTDGITEYEIIIDRCEEDTVWYYFAYGHSSIITKHSCSLSIFLALYSPQRKVIAPCPPPSNSPSKISWLKRLLSYIGWAKP